MIPRQFFVFFCFVEGIGGLNLDSGGGGGGGEGEAVTMDSGNFWRGGSVFGGCPSKKFRDPLSTGSTIQVAFGIGSL